MAGSVNDVNSLSEPTGDFLVSVVCRMSGKSAKRTKGTESSAPTNAEPTASNAPRKDRRFWRSGSAVVDFKVNPSEFAAHISTPPYIQLHENSRTVNYCGALIAYLFLRQCTDVSHQLRNVIGFQFFPESRHLSLAVGDRRRKLGI